MHEAFAKEVDQHTFYHLRESGGTKISTAYELINAAIDSRVLSRLLERVPLPFLRRRERRQPRHRPVHGAAAQDLLPKLNLFCFGQVRSRPTAAAASRTTSRTAFPGEAKVVTSEIRDKDEIYDAIKRFLGKWSAGHRDAAKVRRCVVARIARAAPAAHPSSVEHEHLGVTVSRGGARMPPRNSLALRATHARHPPAAIAATHSLTTRRRRDCARPLCRRIQRPVRGVDPGGDRTRRPETRPAPR